MIFDKDTKSALNSLTDNIKKMVEQRAIKFVDGKDNDEKTEDKAILRKNMYGTDTPDNVFTDPVEGQIYFQIIEE